jgi:hypothetical protein
MAKYTAQLRNFIDQNLEIFDFDYPIFDEKYRAELEKKILDYYYFREIGFETFAQFKWYLKIRMNRIMPYYNQLYDSEHLINKDDYFINQNSTETHTKTTSTKMAAEVESNAEQKNDQVFSDTPSSKLGNEDYATAITTNTINSNDVSGSSSNMDYIENYTITLSGGGGLRYNADILMEWRKSFLNIDSLIIDDLATLFMNIY